MAQDPKSALLEKMNVYLANQQVNYFKTLSMHWYIKGKSFFVLHKKLIIRKRCTSDKRRIFIRLNEAEMDVYNRQHAQVMQIVENLIATLGEEQTKQVIKLLRALADTADKELGNHKD